jgi:hypothetical protein
MINLTLMKYDDDVDPWSALCVVGLKLYSQDPDLSIHVIIPSEDEKTGLDIDDKLADMVAKVRPRGDNLEKENFAIRRKTWGPTSS